MSVERGAWLDDDPWKDTANGVGILRLDDDDWKALGVIHAFEKDEEVDHSFLSGETRGMLIHSPWLEGMYLFVQYTPDHDDSNDGFEIVIDEIRQQAYLTVARIPKIEIVPSFDDAYGIVQSQRSGDSGVPDAGDIERFRIILSDYQKYWEQMYAHGEA